MKDVLKIIQFHQNQSYVRKRRERLAVLKDALIRYIMEEFVTDMVQRERNANMRDAQTKL